MSIFERILSRLERQRVPTDRVAGVTWMADEIVKCYEMDMLCWYIIYGRTGAGKSTYAIMSFAQATEVLGHNVDWEYMDKHIVFTLEDLLQYFKMVENERRRGLGVILDDAGVHFHSYKAFTDRELTMRITSVLQLARIYTSNIIITTPNPNFILRMMRIIPDTYFIAIARRATTAVAGVYLVKFYPPSRLTSKKIVVEEYTLKMPFKDKYDRKRAWYLKEQLIKYEQLLQEGVMGG